jgi:hypothetical protein
MSTESSRLESLLIGADRGRTRRAILLAVGFVALSAAIAYLNYWAKFQYGVLGTLDQVFLLKGYLPHWYAPGPLFAVSLAALAAYLNAGYVPSVLLGWSLPFGSAVWTLSGWEVAGPIWFTPVAAFERTFPEAFVVATVGFVIGVNLRSNDPLE